MLRESAAGKLMTETNQKTGSIGFVLCLDNVIHLYNHMVKENGLLAYFPTSKLSQDHFELFFGAVRSFGYCNNKTAKQFAAAYKRFIVHREINDIEEIAIRTH